MTKGLAFLNKKNWHPNTLKNQEKVWIAEREADAELKRIREIQRKYEEDRKLQELQEIRDAAGLGPKTTQRLEWMYQSGPEALKPSSEEYLLGKPVEIKEQKEDTRTLGLWRRQEITPQQDSWNKLRDDPLLEIEKRKQAQIQHIKENPVKMEKLKQKIKVEVKVEVEVKMEKPSPRKRSPSPRRSRSRSRSPKRHARRSPERRSPSRRSRSPSRRNRSPPRRSRSPSRRSKSPSRRSPVRRSKSPSRRRRTPPESEHKHRSSYRRDDRRDNNKVDREEEKKKKEEERLRKLEQMRLDGEQHQREKVERVQREEEQAKKEEEALAKQAEQPNFMKQMNKNVYNNDNASMEDRIRRNAHYIQRTKAAEGTFLKVK